MFEGYFKFYFFNFETNNVSSRILDGAKQFIEKENIFFDKATSDSDQIFLNYCKNNIENSEPLLCLRSRVSKSIANCVQRIFSDNSDDLKFDELALMVLNDDGRDYLRLSDKRVTERRYPKREKINWALSHWNILVMVNHQESLQKEIFQNGLEKQDQLLKK